MKEVKNCKSILKEIELSFQRNSHGSGGGVVAPSNTRFASLVLFEILTVCFSKNYFICFILFVKNVFA